ncbi:hypothetical protein KSS87_006673 [Heliosperma pusillum]|nr:hypothetical protein KSS87_006673 [Heliosperma pusillum]
MSKILIRVTRTQTRTKIMTEAVAATTTETGTRKWTWPSLLRWIPTSTDQIIASEKRLLSTVKTPCVVEQVNIGSGPPGSKVRWFRSTSNEPRFINTVTFDSKDDAPTMVMVHGYGASQGFFFRNFDALARRFRVIAIDQLGWGGSSRPDFTCKSTEETEAWFIDSLEEWRKAKNLNSFILLGHSFGGYVASKYALKRIRAFGTKFDYVYHTLAAKGSGELCLKYIFSFGAFARKPLLNSASEWKVPTTFIYGYEDWMSYQGAQEARKSMKVPCEIIRVPQGGHFVFIDNPNGFHAAVLYACRKILSPNPDSEPFPKGLTAA